MKKKLIKIILLILIIVSVFNYYTVYATDYDHFKPTLTNERQLADKAGVILGYINIVGVVVSVTTIVIIGVKYMLGSVDEKAEYKKTAITYLIGAFLVFSVTTIPNFMFNIGSDINMQAGGLIYCPNCKAPKECSWSDSITSSEVFKCDSCGYRGGGWISD